MPPTCSTDVGRTGSNSIYRSPKRGPPSWRSPRAALAHPLERWAIRTERDGRMTGMP